MAELSCSIKLKENNLVSQEITNQVKNIQPPKEFKG